MQFGLQELALVAAILSPIATGLIAFASSQAGTRAALESQQLQIDQVREDAARAHERIDQIHAARRVLG